MSSSQYHGTSTTSSLRPRNKRLISIEDGDGLTQQSIDLTAGPRTAPLIGDRASASAHGSRNASPHGSATGMSSSGGNRRQPSQVSTQTTGGTSKWNLPVPTPSSARSFFSPKYWENSWSSLQGVATTFLGTDMQDTPRSATLPRAKVTKALPKYALPAEDEWGPTINVENSIAAGSQEDRKAQIQARKRQALLVANGHNNPDARGRYKRKMSVDDTEVTVQEHSEDALVYVHIVQPTDTVMGLAIKYGCSDSIVRKANRLWANDSMQLKRVAYIPVDACSVKGQKIEAPTRTDQSTATQDKHPLSPGPTDWSISTTPTASQSYNSMNSPSMSATTTSHDTHIQHVHESWVQIVGFATSTEIARLPRRTLGFFPPPRRKSITYQDSISGATSPMLSPADSPPNQSNRSVSTNLSLPSDVRRSRPRAVSALASPNTVAMSLRGPGGVGSLGVEARAPGPAQDKLNTFFAAHFPNAAIPIVGPSDGLSQRPSFESLRSGFSTPSGTGGLEQIGGKVETWVRKLASKGIKEFNHGSSGNGSRRGSVGQLINSEVQGDGDLIEMMDGMDLLGSSDNQDSTTVKGKASVLPSRLGVTSDRADDSDALRERFPVGGRVFESVKK